MIEADKIRRVGLTSATAGGRFNRARFCFAPRAPAKRWLALRGAAMKVETRWVVFKRQSRVEGRAPGVAMSRRGRG